MTEPANEATASLEKQIQALAANMRSIRENFDRVYKEVRPMEKTAMQAGWSSAVQYTELKIQHKELERQLEVERERLKSYC